MTELINLLEANDKLSGLLFDKFLKPQETIEEHYTLPDMSVEYDEQFFETFKDRIDWVSFSRDIPLDDKIINKFKEPITKEIFITSHDKGVIFSRNTKIKWNSEFIDRYYGLIDWHELTLNPSVPWDKSLYQKYKDKVYVIGHLNNGLIGNKGIFWKEDLIMAAVDDCDNDNSKKWYLEEFTRISNIQWNLNLICKYHGLINLQNVLDRRTLSVTFQELDLYKDSLKQKGFFTKIAKYEKLKWNFELIKQFEDYIDFEQFSKATNIQWTQDIFEYYLQKWNFNILSTNYSFCWTVNLFNQYKDKWNIKSISNLTTFPWTEQLIEENLSALDINTIIARSKSFLSGTFIDKHKDLINWTGNFRSLANHRYIYEASAISQNTNIEVNIETLKEKAIKWETGDNVYTYAGEDCYQAPGEWHYFSMNRFLSNNHLAEFADQLSWDILSKREDLDWTITFLAKFSEYWKWEDILANTTVQERVFAPNMNTIKLYFQFFAYNKHWANFINKGGWRHLKRN